MPFSSAQDHKRAYDGDQGPNTGGMGAYSPAHLMTPELEHKILERLIEPTVKAMAAEGCPFSGVLFAGVMVVKGEPILLEYNARFGDPECQTLMLRLQGDMLQILNACAQGRLSEIKNHVSWSPQHSVCIVIAAKGYPGEYKKNTPIHKLADADNIEGAIVFHAGTVRSKDGQILSAGGRVLGVSALGGSILDAQSRAYAAVDQIDWPDGFCRRDIAWRAIAKAKG